MARKRTQQNGTRDRNGTREARPARSRGASSSGGGLLASAGKGALVAVSLLVIYLAYNHYRDVQKENERTRDHNRQVREESGKDRYEYVEKDTPEEPDRAAEEAVARVPDRAPEPAAPAEPSAAFSEYRGKGNGLFFEGRFQQAAEAYETAAEHPAPGESIAKMRRAAEACRMFADVTEGVKPSVEASADNLYTITLKGSGAQIRAKVTHQDADTVTYIKDKIRGSLPRANIDSMEKIDQGDVESRLRGKLQEEKGRAAAEDTALAYYQAGVAALEFAFPGEAAKLLKEAYDLAQKDGTTLRQVVHEYRAAKIFKIGAYYYSVGVPDRGGKEFRRVIDAYPDTKAARLARETLAELASAQKDMVFVDQKRVETVKREEHAAPAAPATRDDDVEISKRLLGHAANPEDVTGKDMATIKKANAAYTEGVTAYNEAASVESARESNRQYEIAIDKLTLAFRLYGKALESDPGNSTLENRAQDAQRKLYWSKKSLRCGM